MDNVDKTKLNPYQRTDGCDGVKQLSFPEEIRVNSGGRIDIKCMPKGCIRIFSAVFDCELKYTNRKHTLTAKSLCEGKSDCSLKANNEIFPVSEPCKGP